jgi:hypothetical protein
VLEIFAQARTDEAVAGSFLALTLNNDTGNNYVGVADFSTGTSSSFSNYPARANIPMISHGSSGSAWASSHHVTVPNYLGTTFAKTLLLIDGEVDVTAANKQIEFVSFVWDNTAALSRLKIATLTAAKKLKVGTTLTIYKRLAS